MAPGATLIFKIFLSPLDPQGEMLRSQLQLFFPGPDDGAKGYEEFDEENLNKLGGDGLSKEGSRPTAINGGVGHDTVGRRGGVWVRKPRSSRKGSGGEYIHRVMEQLSDY
jgi:tRNA (cytidine32/guanosine34-2'-O)-methyltransferase